MSSETEWLVIENALPAGGTKKYGKSETLFSLANGHVGIRGDFEEEMPSFQRGTYINGFFETEPIIYGELAHGFAKNHQTMLNVPDGRLIALRVDGELFSMTEGTALSYRRTLDMRSGILERRLEWKLKGGRQIELTVRRLVSFERSELAAVSYAVKVRGKEARIQITSSLDLGSHNIRSAHDPRVGSKLAETAVVVENRLAVADSLNGRGTASARLRTVNSGLHLACAALTVLESPAPGSSQMSCRAEEDGHRLNIIFEGKTDGSGEVKITKYLAYSKPDKTDGKSRSSLVEAVVNRAAGAGFAALAAEQRAGLDRFWHVADIAVGGDAPVQQALRFNLFHMLQSAGRDGSSNLAAKGLSGEGYEGHYFWDTEIYALPLFTFTAPRVAHALLQYRYAILDKARARAEELDSPGALYPWRTIDGSEASAYYEAGTAQYHINADVIHAARRYALVSGDRDFMEGPLAEMAVETARFWYALGDFIDRPGVSAGQLARRTGNAAPVTENTAGGEPLFCINCVTGPDEYTALVNNNVYTNLMARMNLDWAEKLISWMRNESGEKYRELAERLKLREGESADWARAADRMFVAWDAKEELFPQDDGFFNKAVWNVNESPQARRPLLLHYHPLNIYRYQVLKQPDLVLAQFLQGDLFTLEEKRRNFAYYEPITTGDSSLSHCIQSIMAAEIGETAKAWDYFHKTVRMDIDDLHHNVHDGIHAAAMAGSWLSVIYGFGGFREHVVPDTGGPQAILFSFNPVLPGALTSLRFRLDLGSGVVELDCSREEGGGQITVYRLIGSGSARFLHGHEPVILDESNKEICMRGKNHERH